MQAFDELVGLLATLRAPGGCPWDREQTHESIRRYAIEEAFEVAEAIDSGDADDLRLELGDLLLQVVFHAQIASESGRFDMQGVCQGVIDKMTRRHPHVFGDVDAADAEAVARNWEEIKAAERGESASVLDGVPRALPALQRAERISEKASKGGYDWNAAADVVPKIAEEAAELAEAHDSRDARATAAEFGDLLFSLVNYGRKLGIDPEEALSGTVRRFEDRFRFAEARALESGQKLRDLSSEARDELWEEAKRRSGPDAETIDPATSDR